MNFRFIFQSKSFHSNFTFSKVVHRCVTKLKTILCEIGRNKQFFFYTDICTNQGFFVRFSPLCGLLTFDTNIPSYILFFLLVDKIVEVFGCFLSVEIHIYLYEFFVYLLVSVHFIFFFFCTTREEGYFK